MKQAYFVTGTDTGIGKTFVSAILARGLSAHYWKPIQTGTIEGSDSQFVSEWIGADRVLPERYRFPQPLSPHLAAPLADAEVTVEECLNAFQALPRPLIIEGAGGVLVPLNDKELMIDLITRLGTPAIVVASTRLGTINHTLLTLEALRRRNIPIVGVFTNGEANWAVQNSIRQYGQVEILGHVPHCPKFSKSAFDDIYRSFSGDIYAQ